MVCNDIGSPLKRLRAGTQENTLMKRAGREAAGELSGVKQARLDQTKAAAQLKDSHMVEKQPSEREIAAAKAARARLYGGEVVAEVWAFVSAETHIED